MWRRTRDGRLRRAPRWLPRRRPHATGHALPAVKGWERAPVHTAATGLPAAERRRRPTPRARSGSSVWLLLPLLTSFLQLIPARSQTHGPVLEAVVGRIDLQPRTNAFSSCRWVAAAAGVSPDRVPELFAAAGMASLPLVVDMWCSYNPS